VSLIKETGSAAANSNSYADATDGDLYHEAHLYASSWTSASTATKEAALIMATRLLDAYFHYFGFKRLSTQALQWPRRLCPDPDSDANIAFPSGVVLPGGPYLSETAIPPALRDACCELARELIKLDRTADPAGEGLKSFQLDGTLRAEFDPTDRPPVITDVVQTLLAKLGRHTANRARVVPLVRG
jgi:hypothetical protein